MERGLSMTQAARPGLAIPNIRIALLLLLLLTALAGFGTFFGVPVMRPLGNADLRHDGGHAYVGAVASSWPLVIGSDSVDAPDEALTELFEDGKPLGPPHQMHADIRKEGRGKFSHWSRELYFSASDNGDPRTNGRRYTARLRVFLAPSLSLVLGLSALLLLVKRVYSDWCRKTDRSRAIHDGIRFILTLAIAILSGWGAMKADGVVLWAMLCSAVVAAIWVLHALREIGQDVTETRSHGVRVGELTLAAMSIGLTLMATEAVLAWHEKGGMSPDVRGHEAPVPSHEIANSRLRTLLTSFSVSVPSEVLAQVAWRQSLLTMPQEWERRSATVEGAARASQWHGVLHVYDANGIRRTSDFEAKRSDTFRVMVVGDSLTYGDGIEERFTYPAVLQRLMEEDYAIEFLNLGSDGMQSEDIKKRIYEFVPRLRPNLVIYGVCHNDFLPSGVGQYAMTDKFSIPIPERVKRDLMARSRILRLTGDGYGAFLLRVGLRADFYDDILKDFRNYQGRFAQDVAGMNAYVLSQGLPPIVAIVLDQKYPAVDPRPYEITKVAERHLARAGMDVIDTEPYYRSFSDQNLTVSRWEGHPNEVANAIWARMIETHVRNRSDLKPFARQLR